MLFAMEVLGLRLWSRQKEILNAAATHPQVAVRSGHKIGKSVTAVILALWWVATRPDARVIMTSASGRQVREVLWRELTKVYRKARVPLGGVLHKVPDAGYQLPDGRQILGFSTDAPEKMAGISGENILWILDEASGIHEEIFAAIEGNSAASIRMVMFSNPTRTSGYFYEAFHGEKARFWKGIKVSSAETPNARTGKKVIPGLAGKEWVEQKAKEYGKGSAFYGVRILGEFPAQGTNNLILLHLITEAVDRYEHAKPSGSVLDIGVDVARFGDDDSAISPVRGKKAYPIVEKQGLDGPQLAEAVLQVALGLRDAKRNERVRVKVDVIGVGASCYDHLVYLKKRDKLDWLEVFAVNVSEAAIEAEEMPAQDRAQALAKPRYYRLRDQLWGALKDWLKDGGAIPENVSLQEEMREPTYSFASDGSIKVESKDSIKARLGRSPDRADALCLAIFTPPSVGLSGAARLRAGASW